MYCQKCGEQIPNESVYCMRCGTPTLGGVHEVNVHVSQPLDSYPSTNEEMFYEDVMKNHVLTVLKNPAGATWPRYEAATWTQYGTFKKKHCLETHIDATNSYGGQIRVLVRIKVNDDGSYKNFALKNPSDTIFVDYYA